MSNINRCSIVSWGIYGGTTQLSKSTQAHLAASWGLFATGASAVVSWLQTGYWWNFYYQWIPWV